MMNPANDYNAIEVFRRKTSRTPNKEEENNNKQWRAQRGWGGKHVPPSLVRHLGGKAPIPQTPIFPMEVFPPEYWAPSPRPQLSHVGEPSIGGGGTVTQCNLLFIPPTDIPGPTS